MSISPEKSLGDLSSGKDGYKGEGEEDVVIDGFSYWEEGGWVRGDGVQKELMMSLVVEGGRGG